MSEHTILLVDDDPEIVKTVKRYLQHEDYAVLAAQQRSARAIRLLADSLLQQQFFQDLAILSNRPPTSMYQASESNPLPTYITEKILP